MPDVLSNAHCGHLAEAMRDYTRARCARFHATFNASLPTGGARYIFLEWGGAKAGVSLPYCRGRYLDAREALDYGLIDAISG
jgi:hypothetical protein